MKQIYYNHTVPVELNAQDVKYLIMAVKALANTARINPEIYDDPENVLNHALYLWADLHDIEKEFEGRR